MRRSSRDRERPGASALERLVGRSLAARLTLAALVTFTGALVVGSLTARARPRAAGPRDSTHTTRLQLAIGAHSVAAGHGFWDGPRPPTTAECKRVVHLACYSPDQLQRAYHLRGLYARGWTGRGRTIVIVDPFGSPTIRHDLQVFDHRSGVPAPPSFRVLQPVGRVPPYDPNNPAMTGKAAETTGDVELAHAFAPGAGILLVETPVAETDSGGGFARMLAAEDYVIRHNLGDVISQSFSLPEQNLGRRFLASLRYAYRDAYRHRVSVLAASNDFGVTGPSLPTGAFYTHRVVYWPASDPLVTAVGGTRLRLNRAGKRTSPDAAWNDSHSLAVSTSVGPEPWASNGGLSKLFARPAYQDALRRVVGDRRGVPDVALSAAFRGGTLAYGSFRVGSYRGAPGWFIGGGTSAATPDFAGIVAIADQYAHRRLGFLNPALYRLELKHARGIVDVVKSNNTVTFALPNGAPFKLKGYRAKHGYDLVTGIGTVDASRLVPELAAAGKPTTHL